jgi:hypothetical protein
LLDPCIHFYAKMMDCRGQPGNDRASVLYDAGVDAGPEA